MIHQLPELFYNELLSCLSRISKKIKKERKYKLYDYYFRIYKLLTEIQDCNRDFLYELNLAKRTTYKFYLIRAFKTIEMIEAMHRRIFTIIGDELYHDSIMGLLRTDQYSTYRLLSRFTGEKFQRIYFWKQTLEQFGTIAKNTIEELSKEKFKDNIYNIHVTELEIIPLDIDVLTKDYEYVKGMIMPEVKQTDMLLSKDFIEKQIENTKNTIRELDKVIGSFNTLIKGQISIYQMMNRNYKKL